MNSNRTLSEQFAAAGEEWVDAEAAASLLEDSKSAVLAQKVLACGDMAVNRAETLVKASMEWQDYIEKTVKARRLANLKKVELEAMRMRYGEWQSQEANERVQARL